MNKFFEMLKNAAIIVFMTPVLLIVDIVLLPWALFEIFWTLIRRY